MSLYILPFDHRSTFVKGVFGFSYPLSAKQRATVESYKRLVFEGFLKARNQYRGGRAKSTDFVIFIDEEFGMPVIREAKRKRVVFSLAVEQSGREGFHFAYGRDFGKHLLRVRPPFAKALVRYRGGEGTIDVESKERLREFVRFARTHNIATVIEIVITPSVSLTAEALSSFERFARPKVTVNIIRELRRAQVIPTVWKLESQASVSAWKKIIRAVNQIPIVVLGGGKSDQEIRERLKYAAPFSEIIGFAIGRTVFGEPLIRYRKGDITKRDAVNTIAASFLSLVEMWEGEKKKSASS